MISEDSGSSSESEAAAELLESVLGFGDFSAAAANEGGAPAAAANKKKNELKKEKQQQQQQEEQQQQQQQPYNGLKLEFKGLPLEVGPPLSSSSSSSSNNSSSSSSSSSSNQEPLLQLQQHQKVLRLIVDGDPAADPAG
ncbi:hypothetical protein, conserved [Eimeria brunetti]|uniref:Uncharacterized protein n=1 Tax=Eimeria brunetti TaxID=51314 RepID=U6LEC1_9EIME|nr:hypothetical protein, conserved [Eimeria brunetti]